MHALALETLKYLASQAGLAVISIAEPSELLQDRAFLEEWQAAGYAAEMNYMQRSSELLSSPARLLEGVRSIVVIGAYYDQTPRRPLSTGYGRVARYAWGRDYHKVLRKRLEQLVELVKGELRGEISYRLFSDSVPLLERALARRSGLGFIGKNTMMIVPGRGSFLFLGEILWDVEIDLGKVAPIESVAHCGSCTRCISKCPTQAFVKERVLDAGRCISYLTIEKRGALSLQEREWLGEWIFGCDICQEVCPFNFVALKKRSVADLPELGAQAGAGEALAIEELLSIRSDPAFIARFGGTAIMRAKREGLLRNAAVVAANTGALKLAPLLNGVSICDQSPVVRQHALWAYAKLGTLEGSVGAARVAQRLSRARQDPDLAVRQEAESLLIRLPK